MSVWQLYHNISLVVLCHFVWAMVAFLVNPTQLRNMMEMGGHGAPVWGSLGFVFLLCLLLIQTFMFTTRLIKNFGNPLTFQLVPCNGKYGDAMTCRYQLISIICKKDGIHRYQWPKIICYISLTLHWLHLLSDTWLQ